MSERYLGDKKHLIDSIGLELIKNDGMTNVLTGFNTAEDRKQQFQFHGEERLSIYTRKSMAKDSGLTRSIINSLVDDSLKKDVNIKHDKAPEINTMIENFDLFDWFKRAGKEGRQNGGACILWQINDGQSFEMPVNPERIQKIEPLLILSKDYLQPLSKDNMTNKPLSYYVHGTKPEYYYTYHQSIQNGVLFHKSRVMMFEGEYCGEENLNENNSFKESIIDICRLSILLYEIITGSVATLADSAIQEILKLEGLQNDLAGKEDEKILEKMLLMVMSKSIAKRLVIDKEDDYEYHSANLSGYKDLESIAKSFASLCSKIPQIKLFGDNPQSSIGGQSGSYQENLWYSTIEEYQKDQLKGNFNKFFSWCKNLLNISAKDSILWNFEPLQPVDRKTESEADNREANTLCQLIDKEVLTNEEARTIIKRKYNLV